MYVWDSRDVALPGSYVSISRVMLSVSLELREQDTPTTASSTAHTLCSAWPIVTSKMNVLYKKETNPQRSFRHSIWLLESRRGEQKVGQDGKQNEEEGGNKWRWSGADGGT